LYVLCFIPITNIILYFFIVATFTFIRCVLFPFILVIFIVLLFRFKTVIFPIFAFKFPIFVIFVYFTLKQVFTFPFPSFSASLILIWYFPIIIAFKFTNLVFLVPILFVTILPKHVFFFPAHKQAILPLIFFSFSKFTTKFIVLA